MKIAVFEGGFENVTACTSTVYSDSRFLMVDVN